MPLPPSRAPGPYRPSRLGQWEVIAKIAGGGMSAVYLGRHVDSAPAEPTMVALKIARHDGGMDERLQKMFLEEGKLIQRLVHPNIVRTLEVGTDADQDFIAMELMLGKTFAAVHDTIAARGVRMNPEIAAFTAARVADALEFAHALTDETTGRPLNVVHRDVNPANVFATFRGEVKLFDFGLAKVTTGDTSSSQQMLAGKLSYLSPEQVMQIPVDRRSDIFTLGITLWEFLTGKRLFRRDSDIDTVRAVQLGPIPDIRQIAPELPEELARITRTALERNRDHRYPSAGYLARELDHWLYQRTSPQEVTARLAQLVDTIFPGEQKKQGGWLKPAISSQSMRPNLGATMASPGNSRPPGPVVRLDTRETTAVMVGVPVPTPRDGIPAIPPSEIELEPGPLTPREGISVSQLGVRDTAEVPASSPGAPELTAKFGSIVPGASVMPPTPRIGSPGPSSNRPGSLPPPSRQKPARVQLDTPPPISRTDVGLPAGGARAPIADPPTDEYFVPPPQDTAIDLESTIVAPDFDLSQLPIPPPPRAPSEVASAPPSMRPAAPSMRPAAPGPASMRPGSPSMTPGPASMRPSGAPQKTSPPTPGVPFKPGGTVPPPKPSPSFGPIMTPSSPFKPVGASVLPPKASPSFGPIATPSAPFKPVGTPSAPPPAQTVPSMPAQRPSMPPPAQTAPSMPAQRPSMPPPAQTVPSMPAQRPSMPPPAQTARPSAAPPMMTPSAPFKPIPTPPGTPSAIGQPRPKRAPIPLPSRIPAKTSVPPKASPSMPPPPKPVTPTKPPDSGHTQTDVTAPKK